MANPRLQVDFVANLQQFQKGIGRAGKSLERFGTRLSAIGSKATLGLTTPLTLAGGSAIKLAMDMEESLNKVDVAFKGSSSFVKQFADTTLESFGISSNQALESASLFGDMATSMGLTTTQSASMATQLVGLAGDLSSFKNIQVEVAQTALAGIFTGETESLKRLGVVMTQTNLEQFALSQGITKNIKEMTEAEKVNLRFAFVMEKTKNAQGDFARTSEGSANQLRIFQQGLVQLGTQFGEVLLPMFQKVMERLNGILTSITKLSPETKKFAVGLGILVSALGPTVLLLGKASIAVGRLMGSIKNLSKATLIFRVKILAITAVIAGLVTAILFVKENFDSFAIFFENLWNGIKRFVLEAVASISSKIAGLLEKVGFDDASAKMQGFIDGVNKSLDSIPEGKETKFQSIGEFIDSLTGKAKELISSLTEIGVVSEDVPDPSERFDTQSAGRADLPSATNVPQLDLSKATVDTSKFKIGMAETTDEMRQLDHFMKDQLSSTLGTVADSFADLFTGDAGAGDFGSRILSVLGDFAIQFGKLAIGIGTASLSLKKSLFANPPQAIASGLILVALGKTIKNVTAKFGEGMKDGGIVPSGFNNDTFPALLSSGERVIPKSRSLPSDMGSNLNLSGEFRIKGSDLVLSLAEANYSLDR
tara:strand:+ start:4172 stop:6124 length:1953 start_codon:yes stop_codon:yes gene_type:complete